MANITLPVLQRGDRGDSVKVWQRILRGADLVVGDTIDGDFGPLTEASTRAWQARNGLPVTGVVDAAAWSRAAVKPPSAPSPPPSRPAIPPPPQPTPTLRDLTKLPFVQARNYTKANRTALDLVVIHDMECPETLDAAEKVAAWFASDSAPQASAHFCCDADSVVQCVRVEDVAWHAPGANNNGIGIEHAGYARQTPKDWADAYSGGMLKLSACLTARLCKRYSIPVVKLDHIDLLAKRRGLCGHVDVTQAFGKPGGHTDPGESFPWPLYLQLVHEALAALS